MPTNKPPGVWKIWILSVIWIVFLYGGRINVGVFSPQTPHLLQQGWFHSKVIGLSHCWSSLLWNHFLQQHWREHSCNRSDNTGGCNEEKLSWERGTHPLAPSICNSGWQLCLAWGDEDRERKAVAHKVVISPPRLLLPHVGFHSIPYCLPTTAHTASILLPIKSDHCLYATKLKISGEFPWSQWWSV